MIFRNSHLVFLILIPLVSPACAHRDVFYREAGAWSRVGFSEEKWSDGIYDVRFFAQTKPRDAGDALLNRRCAEITLRDGFDSFSFYTKSRRTIVRGHVEFPEYYGRIFMSKGPPAANGYDAREILAEKLAEDIIIED